ALVRSVDMARTEPPGRIPSRLGPEGLEPATRPSVLSLVNLWVEEAPFMNPNKQPPTMSFPRRNVAVGIPLPCHGRGGPAGGWWRGRQRAPGPAPPPPRPPSAHSAPSV